MRRTAAWLAALVALAALAQGSTVEDTTLVVCMTATGSETMAEEFCTYQADGGAHRDASDRCAEPRPILNKSVEVEGVVFPPVPPPGNLPWEDPEDDYEFNVTSLGAIRITLLPGTRWSPLTGAPVSYNLAVFGPSNSGEKCDFQYTPGPPAATSPWLGTTYSFVPTAIGPHTIQVKVARVDLTPIEHEIPIACHFMCAHNVNALLGYQINVTDGP